MYADCHTGTDYGGWGTRSGRSRDDVLDHQNILEYPGELVLNSDAVAAHPDNPFLLLQFVDPSVEKLAELLTVRCGVRSDFHSKLLQNLDGFVHHSAHLFVLAQSFLRLRPQIWGVRCSRCRLLTFF